MKRSDKLLELKKRASMKRVHMDKVEHPAVVENDFFQSMKDSIYSNITEDPVYAAGKR